MLRLNKIIFFYLTALISCFPADGIFAQQNADLVLNRHKQFLLNTDTTKVVTPKIIAQQFDIKTRRWKNIDYNDTKPSTWEIRDHLINTRSLALQWAREQNAGNKKQLLTIIISALDEWHQHKFKNRNWWHNEIGIPQIMRDIIALIRPALTITQLNNYLEIVNQYQMKGTGANLIWSADIGLFYGLLTGNHSIAEKAVSLIKNEIKISEGEGLKPDYSFHQHQARLQMYQYGRTFLIDNIRLAWELRGTKWAYEDDKVKLLSSMLLSGWQWMARGIHTIPETMDRSATRMNALHEADVRIYIPYFIELDPLNRSLYTRLKANQDKQSYSLSGLKSFPYSDITTYHQKEYSFFLKTISSRTLTTESINYENLKGKLLNSGETYFIRSGNEYFNLMPVWNWTKLPGITSFDGADKISRKDFSGTVTDGHSGVTAMDYQMVAKDTTKHFTCKKSWFFLQGYMVCLLGDIKMTNIDSAYTVLNQSRLKGDVISGKEKLQKSFYLNTGNKWIWHDDFAYMPLYKSNLSLYADTASGSWYDINHSYSSKKIREEVFMPYLQHHPAADKAGYVVFYTPKKIINKIANALPFTIVQNDAKIQSLQSADGTLLAVFYDTGKLITKTLSVAVDRSCMVLLKKSYAFVSDPSHQGGGLTMKYNNKIYQVTLPADGSTARVVL